MVYYIHSNEITNLGWNPSLRLRRARDVGMFHANSATNLSSFDTTPRIFSGTIKVLKNISQCPFYTFPHIYCTSSIKRSWPITIECITSGFCPDELVFVKHCNKPGILSMGIKNFKGPNFILFYLFKPNLTWHQTVFADPKRTTREWHQVPGMTSAFIIWI